MNQGRRLQGVIRTLPAHVMVSEAPQILVDERRELGESGIIPLAPMRQKLGYFLRGRQRHIAKLPSSPTASKLRGSRAFGKIFQFR